MHFAEHLAHFADHGNQQRLTLRSGRTLQGWIMEITEDTLVISIDDGEQEIRVTLADIEPGSLAYWDTHTQRWQSFPLA